MGPASAVSRRAGELEAGQQGPARPCHRIRTARLPLDGVQVRLDRLTTAKDIAVAASCRRRQDIGRALQHAAHPPNRHDKTSGARCSTAPTPRTDTCSRCGGEMRAKTCGKPTPPPPTLRACRRRQRPVHRGTGRGPATRPGHTHGPIHETVYPRHRPISRAAGDRRWGCIYCSTTRPSRAERSVSTATREEQTRACWSHRRRRRRRFVPIVDDPGGIGLVGLEHTSLRPGGL